MSLCPYLLAMCRGVSPELFCLSGDAPAEMSCATMPLYPYLVAKCSGVSPESF